MPELIVAHDVVCPWCWVAVRQAEWMRADFPTITLRWVGYELLPEGLVYIPKPKDPIDEIKPEVPSRFELLLAADRLSLPKRKGKLNAQAFVEALQSRTYRDRIVEFDDPAHAAGIYNVPTWKFTEKWVAEQPYTVVSEMCKRFVEGG